MSMKNSAWAIGYIGSYYTLNFGICTSLQCNGYL